MICLFNPICTRDFRIMQISRPRLNYLIILGALLSYITIILYAIPKRDKDVYYGIFETIRWTISLGFSLCYGTIIMKMFRVYYIINNPLPNKVDSICSNNIIIIIIISSIHNNYTYYTCNFNKHQNIEDWTMALAVLVFIIIDIILLLSSTIVTGSLGLSTVIVIPNKGSPRTVTGVCKM